jgi:superfamily II DNA or RNA helicase
MDIIDRYKFRMQPYQHQMDALRKSWSDKEFALFAEMGTGKSKILIDTVSMLYDRGQITGFLVVAPKGRHGAPHLGGIEALLTIEAAEEAQDVD